jgi:hypothetical protein
MRPGHTVLMYSQNMDRVPGRQAMRLFPWRRGQYCDNRRLRLTPAQPIVPSIGFQQWVLAAGSGVAVQSGPTFWRVRRASRWPMRRQVSCRHACRQGFAATISYRPTSTACLNVTRSQPQNEFD